jgi:lysozyme
MGLIDLLIKHEGLKLEPYRCTSDKLTIGVGRNLEDCGITEEEAMYLLKNDIKKFHEELTERFYFYSYLDGARKDAMLNMAFNMGVPRLANFVKALDFMSQSKYDKAADEFLDSRWAKQVGNRAIEVAQMIRTNKYPD